MGLADRLKDVTKKAEEKAAEHAEEIRNAAQKAGAAADEHTRGKYSEKIQKAGAKVDSMLDGLDRSGEEAAGEQAAGEQATGEQATGSESAQAEEKRPKT